MSFHSTPASAERQLDRLGAHLHGGLVEPAERMQADADDGDVVRHGCCQSSADRLEGEGDDLVAVVIGGERHHRQLDLLAELQLRRIVLGEPALDPDDVVELDQARRRRARSPCPSAPCRARRAGSPASSTRRGCPAGQQQVGHLAGAALGAALLDGEGGGAASAALLPMSCGFSSGQVEISGASALCVVDTGLTIIGNGVLV